MLIKTTDVVYQDVVYQTSFTIRKEALMDLEYVKEFICLAKIKNYMEAADNLFISQSALSKHIQAIEAELGVQLFERSSRKAYLNEAGELFLTYANRLIETYDECTESFLDIAKSGNNSLAIASIPMMTQYGITDWLAKFRRENPNVGMNVVEGTYYQMLELLRDNKCDFAFVRENDESIEEFKHILITNDWLVAVLPVSHPLASRETIALEELKDEPFLLPVKDTRTYSTCIKACRKAKFEPKMSFTSRGVSTNIDLVTKGMGVALLMRRAAEFSARSDVALVDIVPKVETSIYLLYNKKKKWNNAAVKFIKMFTDEG
ncbi:MAG: LysR family transcriptional regulator [Lachnospiraceae bacterium]|nr:LysR family transcriptional regulator [Lachnospiraceae bacterium]